MASADHVKGMVENITSAARMHLFKKIINLREMPRQNLSVLNLKTEICDVMTTSVFSHSLLWEVLGTNIYQTFCFNNVSLMESFFQAFQKQIPKLEYDPQYQVMFVKEAVSFFSLVSQVQNETSIWHTLLMLPDIAQGAISVKDMSAALQNTSRFVRNVEDSPPVLNDDGLKNIENVIGSLLSALKCSKQDMNNSVMNNICEFSLYGKNNQTLFSDMKHILRKISSPEFVDENFVAIMSNLTKDLESTKKSLQLFKGLQEKFKNVQLLKQYESNMSNMRTILRLTEILRQQTENNRDNKLEDLLNTEEKISRLYNLTALLVQNGFNALFDIISFLKESHNFVRSVWDPAFINKTNPKATEAWQTIKMLKLHPFPPLPKEIEKYLMSMQEVPSLFANSLLKPTTIENFPEKILTLQEILGTITNIDTSHRYLLISFLTDMMQKIQDSIQESLWKEFNTYWYIGEKLRSAKWNNTDIFIYGQVLDILHHSLDSHHNGSKLPLKIELEQMTQYVDHLLKVYADKSITGTNVSMVFDVILKTLHVLEDLEEKYISELITVNPLMNTNNETAQRLFQIFKEGIDIISDPKLTEASSAKVMDTLFSFSHLLLLKEFSRSPERHNSSAEVKALELLHLMLRPFLKEDIQAGDWLPNCTVDLHLITIEAMLNNDTLKEELRESNCSFLLNSMGVKNQTTHQHTFMELFQVAVRNLKSMLAFDTLHNDRRKYFSDKFQCLIKSLQFSSGFLSELNSFYNYKNPWIQRMHESLIAISNEFSQSNRTCEVPLLGSADIRNDSSVSYIFSYFMLNETEANVSGSPSVWNQALRSFILLHSEPRVNVTVSQILEVSKRAVKQSQGMNFSTVFSKVADILSSSQNVTDTNQYVQLLEMTRKALVLLATGLALNKTETYQFVETLNWRMNPSHVEEVLGLLSFKPTSDIDYKNYVENLFHTFYPPIDVLTQSLFYTNLHWIETREVLKLAGMVWNQLVLNKTSFKLAKLWETIQKVIAISTPFLPKGILGNFSTTQQVPLEFSNSGLNVTTMEIILEQLSGLQNDYHKTEDANKTDNYPYLSEIRKIIRIATSKSWFNDTSSNNHIHEQLSFITLNGTELYKNIHKSDTLHQLLSVLVNGLNSDFSLELEKFSRVLSYLLQEYVKEASQNHNSDVINAVVMNLIGQENMGHLFNITKLETVSSLRTANNKITKWIYDMWRQGAIVLSDHSLEEGTDKEKFTTLYGYSRFLFQKEFESLLGLNTSAERAIVDILHLSLSPFLDISRDGAGRLQNCSVQDVIHIILQTLFKNATFQEALKQNPCELLFTARETEDRAMPSQTFTEWFQFSIREIDQTTKLSSLYQNKPGHVSSAVLCMIQSIHFSSALLSKIDLLLSFKHPWIHKTYKTLAIVCKELPPTNATCLIPGLGDRNAVAEDSPLNVVPPFFTNEAESYLQNFTGILTDWNNLSMFFRLLRDGFDLDVPTIEPVQMAKEILSSQSEWNNFAQVSKLNFTENKYIHFVEKLIEKTMAHNNSAREILDASVYNFKNMYLDLLKELKADLKERNLSNRSSLEYRLELIMYRFTMAAKTLLNKALLSNEWGETLSLNNAVARFLFSEFENVFIQLLPDNGIRGYMACIMNSTEELDSELSEHSSLPPDIAQLERVLINPHETFKNSSSVPDTVILRLIHLQNLTSLLCDRETVRSLQQTCQLPDISLTELCRQSKFYEKLLRAIELSGHAMTSSIHRESVSKEIQEIVFGDPEKIQQQINWLQENVPQLKYFQDIPKYTASLNSIVNITNNASYSRKQDMLQDLFRNVDDLKNDLRNLIGMSPESISTLMEMPLPENRTQLIFQILQLESCDTDAIDAKLGTATRQFCNLSLAERAHKSYLLGVTFLHHLDVYNFMYKVLLPMKVQTSLDKAFGLLKELDNFKKQVASDIQPLLDAIHSLKKLRQSRNAPLSKALIQTNGLTIDGKTFKTISKALCNQEITPLFFESLLPDFEEQNVHHSSIQEEHVEHIMKKYGIPQDSSPFCLSFFLDLVKTPAGALIWSFLKPMLRGRVLYTPDTPETRAIMEKSNSTLKLMAGLTQKSQEWLDSSVLLMNSLTMLNETIPIVKNTLRNPFVQVFIKLMAKLDAVDLLNQIDELDDIRLELQNNAEIIDQLSTLAGLAVNVSSCVLFDRIQPHKTSEDLEMVAKDLFLKNELFGSVIFHLPSNRGKEARAIPGSVSLPPLVNYTIRMSSKLSQTTRRIREKIWTVGPHNSASQSQIYSRAFVYIQESIDRAIIELQTGKSTEEMAVQVQAIPYPCYNKDMFLTSVTYSLPFTLMAAWILFIAAFVKKLVQEKDLRLYEYMKMMGVNSSSHFFAWFIECATFLLIMNIFLIVALKVGNILPKINVMILFLYLMDYSLSIIAMCYLISVFFNNTNIAALVACLVYILTFFPFIVLLVVENHVSFSVKSLLSLLSPTAFGYASQYIARYEEQGIGMQWDNMYNSPMSGDNTNFGWMCWLILIDSFIYFFLGWYIRNVFPGKYGIAAPWYFPLLPSYWAERYGYSSEWSEKIKAYLFTNFFLTRQPLFPDKTHIQNVLPSNLEPEPTNLKVGVSLHGITKIYESKAAVQNLSLNFYEGNITSLLGHNGAGKTTAISILTGLFPASSGTIFVYGKDIRNDQDIIRKNMGICMQHNVLFNYLTTKEHLFLYGYIKVPHWSKQELREEVDRTLKETGLYNHRHKLAGSLSGGMKRKLSISIALLGGSKVVILDEPTTGVDPCSRRGIWEIISKNRKGRTIILSTHHLDEAEVLSDRIAFLEHGGLKCCGCPFYLKETFGSGYHLTLTKKKSPTLNMAQDCDTSAVTAMIQSHLPEAYLKENVGGELVYVLPQFNSKVSSAYQSLLRALDSGLEDLHIGCYGISDSTMEEVFLNLTKDLTKDKADMELSKDVPSCSMENDDLSDTFTEKDDQALFRMRKPNNFSSLLRKATALFVKRFHHTRRNVKGFIAQVILPVLFVTAAMGLGTLRTKVAEYPALRLSPSMYGSSGQTDFFGNYNETTSSLVAALLSFPGADNTCLNKSNLACFKEEVLGDWMFSGNQSTQYSACNCTDNKQACPKINFSPPHKKSFFSRTIYNLTGHDVETYLLVTTKDFVQKRYGGWSFGLPLTSDLQFDIKPVPANRTITKVWYNPEGYHSLPAYLNSLNNFILRANLPKEKSSGYGISVVAHPYPGGESQEQAMLSNLLDIMVSMSVLIGYSITTASFVLYVVKEHQTKAKQLQHISGISVRSYWVTNFIFDLVYFLVPVTLSVGVISAFQIPAFYNDNNLLAVFLLLFLFGYATFSWMYLLAGIFKETGMAFIIYVCINLFFGINTIISHSVVLLLAQEKATNQGLHDLAETLRHIYLMFPQFCFGYGLIELSQYQALMGFLKAYGVVYPNKTFELDRISSKLLGMFIQGTIFFSIRLLLDDRIIQKVWYKILEFLFSKVYDKSPLQLETSDEEEDKDVQAEQERVALGLGDCDMVQLQNLTKVYPLPHRKIVAVKNVSVGIPAGECFGLLGVNGAGKTTIFKMLTGDIGPSCGRLLVRDETGFLKDIDEGHWSLFGYCPQEDALDDLLTVEEHMYYYARLHGIPEKYIKGIVLQLLYRLNLMPYKHRITSMCSYGTNRKLSTALALLGKPSVLLLDEPSSGMDPNAKRHLWKIITEEVQKQCSVILTSHSMEECEALCTRLAIMVNGRFQCMGSLQHIKSRFGKGFTVKMHLNNDASCVEKLTQFLQTNFPNTHLKDHQLNMVEYHVPVSAGGVANIFQLLEANKASFKIRHFSVSQTTLEEVFINFAKAQTGPDCSDGSSEVDSDVDSLNLSSQDSDIAALC